MKTRTRAVNWPMLSSALVATAIAYECRDFEPSFAAISVIGLFGVAVVISFIWEVLNVQS